MAVVQDTGPLLSVQDLYVAYGGSKAVRGVTFSISDGEAFVLLGANGAGKTSILRSISGLVRPVAGTLSSFGQSLAGMRPHQVAQHGIAHVPEGRRVFSSLTVEENLIVSFLPGRATESLAQAKQSVYALFPKLAERRRQSAGTLSGGEQQMLAIGRALMNFPRLLMLDEPSLGLAPLMTELVFERLTAIRDAGTAILLVEQNSLALEIGRRGIVLTDGAVGLVGDSANLQSSDFVRRAYLGR